MDSALSHRRRLFGCVSVLALWLAMAAAGRTQPAGPGPDLEGTLAKATARVEHYFTRAQSLVCTETVHVQPLNHGLTGDGVGRTVESELRLSWDAGIDGDAAPEAHTHRKVVKVNGRVRREKDRAQCTTAERHDTETQPLSMLLDGQREKYTFALSKAARLDGRAAITVEFKELRTALADVRVNEDDEDCLTYQVDGGVRGRIWIDAESFDVLRLDQHLAYVELRLPETLLRRGSTGGSMIERYDTSTRFKRVNFDDPEEQLVLPTSSAHLFVTRGTSSVRMRTSTRYTGYKRFLTGGRLVPAAAAAP